MLTEAIDRTKHRRCKYRIKFYELSVLSEGQNDGRNEDPGPLRPVPIGVALRVLVFIDGVSLPHSRSRRQDVNVSAVC